MLEKQREQEFLEVLLSEIEEQAIKRGSFQTVFLEQMLKYVDLETDPDVLHPPYENTIKKILVNAYSYLSEEQRLQLFVVDYNEAQDEQEMLSINKSELLSIANKVKRFFTNVELLINNIHPSHQPYDLAKLIVDMPIHAVDIFIMTNRFYRSNKQVDISIPGVGEVQVHIWDAERAYQIHSAETGAQVSYIDFDTQFGETFEMMFVPDAVQGEVKDSFDCYIGFISANLLAKVYDFWGPKLVERNVRSFLQARGATNKGIRDTLKNPLERQMFVAYNNGISTVARKGNIEKISEDVNLYKVKGLDGWQIVNGGQTTASIHRAFKEGISLNDVYIQTKLTILQVEGKDEKDRHQMEDEMVAKISEYANTQNKINKSDLLANTRFMSEIEKFSRNTWIPSQDGRKANQKWYFERARGQYMVDVNRRKKGKEQSDFKKQHPSEKVISKVDLAKHFMSWEGLPYISSKGGEAAFKEFMEYNSAYWKSDRNEGEERKSLTSNEYKKLIARVIISHRVTEIVSEMKLKGYRANVIYYSAAILHEIYGSEIDLLKVWDNQSLSDIWDPIIQVIADITLNYLRESAGDRNVTQWAKQQACWQEYRKEYKKLLQNLR